MLNKITASFCIMNALLEAMQYRNDPQAEAPTDEIITIAILACREFGGSMGKALKFVQESGLFPFMPSESRLGRRLHSPRDILPSIFPLLQAIWGGLENCTNYSIDTLLIPTCENIRADRCKIAPGMEFRGWIPSHRKHFHGVKFHLINPEKGFSKEFLILPGSRHNVLGLYQTLINLPPGSNLFADRAYTDCLAEDLLEEAEGIGLLPIRKRNSKCLSPPLQYLSTLKRRIIETIGSCINALFRSVSMRLPWKGFSLRFPALCWLAISIFCLRWQVGQKAFWRMKALPFSIIPLGGF